MNKATDPVLELLDDVDIAISKNAIRHELQKSLSDPPDRTTIHRGVTELEERDYVIRPKGPNTKILEITDRGREYLRGERDAGDDA